MNASDFWGPQPYKYHFWTYVMLNYKNIDYQKVLDVMFGHREMTLPVSTSESRFKNFEYVDLNVMWPRWAPLPDFSRNISPGGK